MDSAALPDHLNRYATPLVVSLLVALAVLAVPPMVLGELTGRTYALTAAVLIIALGSVLPYALLVALGTLPLFAVEGVSFIAPPSGSDADGFSAVVALRHVAAGIYYVLAAAVVGAIGIATQIGAGNAVGSIPEPIQPVLFYGGGLPVAAAFVSLHLWQYDAPVGDLDRWTVLGTVGLGGLLALAPVVTFWVFNGGV